MMSHQDPHFPSSLPWWSCCSARGPAAQVRRPAGGRQPNPPWRPRSPGETTMYGAIAFTRTLPLVRRPRQPGGAMRDLRGAGTTPGRVARKIALNLALKNRRRTDRRHPGRCSCSPAVPGQAAVGPSRRWIRCCAGCASAGTSCLVDQRGTGKSNSSPASPATRRRTRPSNRPPRPCAPRPRPAWPTCRSTRTCASTPPPTRWRTWRRCARRSAPTGSTLMGVSYGTRVAQRYAMHHPDATRSIVLDSPIAEHDQTRQHLRAQPRDALALQFANAPRWPPAGRAGRPARTGDPAHQPARATCHRPLPRRGDRRATRGPAARRERRRAGADTRTCPPRPPCCRS